ncbi:DUF7660 family protein [Undibacterium flavidum]|uniref:DUF7660 domain-containing protein n=1 Tax=Undibacterium flavidum TaxID=2762297 RepID=A0ABR6YEU2_9BURK|nr:hypothetical protein [Undibacterium flavidum]MBC3875094.1 hypothetical protein [Undibacterium flavidum]
MAEKLNELLDAVTDGPSFLAFVAELRSDRELEVQSHKEVDDFGRGSNGWENHTIESFLEAASAWAESSDFGLKQGLSAANPWRQFAVFLYCGKIYE